MPISQSAAGMDHSHKGTPGMWGALTTQGLQALSLALLWVTAVAGGIAAIAGLLSALAANRASDAIQADADKRIAEAHSTAATADARAAEANAKIAAAQTDVAKANERAAKLESEAAVARLETERLKQLTAWREIAPDTAHKLGELLAASPHAVVFEFDNGDAEAKHLAITLANIFEAAHWRIGVSAGINAAGMSFGLFVPEGPQPATDAVRKALAGAGLGFSTANPPAPGVTVGGGAEPGAARLVVGVRPPPSTLRTP